MNYSSHDNNVIMGLFCAIKQRTRKDNKKEKDYGRVK